MKTQKLWSRPGGACVVEMAAGFRVHLSQGPILAGCQRAATKLAVEPEAAGLVERWILALQASRMRRAWLRRPRVFSQSPL